MKQKIFLTSALAMGFVAPAFAEPSNTGTFPNDGYMQEDYTYTNAATEANMGVYEGSVNATAEYTDDLYNIVAGNYLAAGSEDENGTQCTAGNFCPGLTNVYYNENTDQGLNSCSTATNGIYTLSAAGASSQNDCYRQCSGNVTIEHATGVTGNDYYGNGADTCSATGCDNGYSLHSSGINGQEIYSTYLANRQACDDDPNYNMFDCFLSNVVTEYGGSSYGDPWYAEINNNPNYYPGFDRVDGIAKCSSSTAGDNHDAKYLDTISDENGGNCWYKITKVNGQDVIGAKWVSNGTFYSGTYEDCVNVCKGGYNFVNNVNNYESLSYVVSKNNLNTCEANTITINWSDAAQTDIDANNAGTATYGSDVRTPVKAQTIKGKTFRGWRFSKPEQTNLP